MLMLAIWPFAGAWGADRISAERALMDGRLDEAVAGLHGVLQSQPKDGRAHLLLCRAYYAEELANEAVGECEAALQTLSKSSEAQDWMGRAYGKKADRSGPIAGFKLARRVKTAFEAAVALDANNGDAVNDLSEYYVSAPAVVGGGTDKAAALADRVKDSLPQQSHRIQALLAEKRHDYDAAEREFQAAVKVAGRPDALADLGGYYSRRRDFDKAIEALKRCIAADKTQDASTVDAASILNDMHREPALAKDTLRAYLASGAKSDAAPVVHVRTLLGQMLAAAGDKGAAKIEFTKALALAAQYAPARHALDGL